VPKKQINPKSHFIRHRS